MNLKIETLESKEAESLVSKFKSEIDMESATTYDPRNANDLDHLAKYMALVCVNRILKLDNVYSIFWEGVKEHIEEM